MRNKNHLWIGGSWDYWHNLARRKMEEHIGRKLERKELVHHRNGMWKGEENNIIENLQIVSRKEHIKMHQKEIISARAEVGYHAWNKGIKTGPNPSHSEKMKGRTPWNKGMKNDT